jgi:hypothetical protein
MADWNPEMNVDAKRLARVLYDMRLTGPIAVRYSISFFEDNHDVFMVTAHIDKDGKNLLEQTIVLPVVGWQDIVNHGFKLADLDRDRRS